MSIYSTFKNFKGELESLVLRVESHWVSLVVEIKFFAGVETFVDDFTRTHFQTLVGVLHAKLQILGSKLQNLSSGRRKLLGKIKFALLAKGSLEAAIAEFAKWHKLLLPLLYLLPRSTDPRIDRQILAEQAGSNKAISTVQNLKRAFTALAAGNPNPVIFVPDAQYYSNRQLIRYTAVQSKRLSDNRHVIIDSISCEGPGGRFVPQDVRNLAGILKEVDPMTFGIPACAGVVKIKNSKGQSIKLEMVFNVPEGLNNPRSLRDLLLSLDIENESHPINVRIQLAKRLARTVLSVHSANFVHKNFRPETIIVFDHRNNKNINEIGVPFLVGFQKVRAAGGYTALMGDNAWEQDIYRHPTRQGHHPEEIYTMQHDIYSLGVCLLEIALWKSFVSWDASGRYPLMTPESEQLLKGNTAAVDTKDKLVKMAREVIPKRLGTRYTEVTISCLKCLDHEDGDNSELLAENDISVGASYIGKVRLSTNTEQSKKN